MQNQNDFNILTAIKQCEGIPLTSDRPLVTFDREDYAEWASAVGLSDVPNLNTSPIDQKIKPFGEWIKANTKLSEIHVYKQDVKVKRICVGEVPPGNNGAKRSEATEISKKSLDELRFVGMNTDVNFRSIVTLTYPGDYPTDGKAVKKHLNSLLTRFRSEFEGMAYIWVIEFQVRGAPHYHIVTDIDLEAIEGKIVKKRRRAGKYTTNIDLEKWLARTWNRIIFDNKYWSPKAEDKEKHLRAGVAWETIWSKDGGAKYIAKYASKPYQKQIPEKYQNIGRAWGCSRNVRKQINKITSLNMDGVPVAEDEVMHMLKELEWDNYKSVEKLGYLPKTLFGVGKLLLKPNKAVDEKLIYFYETNKYIAPKEVYFEGNAQSRLDDAVKEYKYMRRIEEIYEAELRDTKLMDAREFNGYLQEGDEFALAVFDLAF